MSALHDARVPRGTIEVLDGHADGVLTARVLAAPAFAWPTAEAPRKPAPWQRLARRVYRLLTPDLDRPSLHNFSYLGQRLSRGAQPGREGFRALAELGVTTVINLRLEACEEEAIVRGFGMDYLYYPLEPLAAPSHAQVLAFLHTVCDPARGHIFFHCYHGADRTGVVAACYRIAHDGWPLERALAELRDHHFHHVFQQPMWAYVREFARFWTALDVEAQDRVLHRGAAAGRA